MPSVQHGQGLVGSRIHPRTMKLGYGLATGWGWNLRSGEGELGLSGGTGTLEGCGIWLGAAGLSGFVAGIWGCG